MSMQKATNITWHHGKITTDDRVKLMGHHGAVIWFTGLPASGKSTLAVLVEAALYEKGVHAYILDGDNIRHGLNKNLGFNPHDRTENIRRIGEVARLFADAGLVVMTAFISPYAADRKLARDLVPPGRFVEVYCSCSLSECEQRDPKGLYKKARTGQIKEFTGIDAPYEIPEQPEIAVRTDQLTEQECTAQVLACLQDKGLIGKA